MGWLRWKEYSRLKKLAPLDSQIHQTPEDIYFPDGKVTEVPGVFLLYKRCEKWGNFWAGGVADQPHILLQEFAMCSAAEREFESTVLPQLESLTIGTK